MSLCPHKHCVIFVSTLKTIYKGSIYFQEACLLSMVCLCILFFDIFCWFEFDESTRITIFGKKQTKTIFKKFNSVPELKFGQHLLTLHWFQTLNEFVSSVEHKTLYFWKMLALEQLMATTGFHSRKKNMELMGTIK